MSTEVTLKRIGFKAGTASAPDPVAEIVLICNEPSDVVHLTRFVSKTVLVDVAPIQQELPLEEEPHTNGTVMPSRGVRRRGTVANVTENE